MQKFILAMFVLCYVSASFSDDCPPRNVIGNAGLSIRYFLNSTDPESDQSAPLQKAVGCLMTSTEYHELNLEGRRIAIAHPIIFNYPGPGDTEEEWFNLMAKKIVNGKIHLRDDFENDGGNGSYAFDFKDQNINGFEFRNITINANGKGNAIRLPNGYIGFILNRVNINLPMSYAVKGRDYLPHERRGNHELKIVNSNIFGAHLGSDIEMRPICVSVNEPDAKIQNNTFSFCRIGIEASGGGLLIQGNHIYGGKKKKEDDYQSAFEFGTCLRLHDRAVSVVITGNYLDQCNSTFERNWNKVQRLNISNNFFLARPSTDANFSYINFNRTDADDELLDIHNTIITSNIVENAYYREGEPNSTANFITFNGERNVKNHQSFIVRDNVYTNVAPIARVKAVRLKPEEYPNTNQYHALFAGHFPEGCHVNKNTVISVTPDTPLLEWDIGFVNGTENIVRIDVSGPRTGKETYEVVASCEQSQ